MNKIFILEPLLLQNADFLHFGATFAPKCRFLHFGAKVAPNCRNLHFGAKVAPKCRFLHFGAKAHWSTFGAKMKKICISAPTSARNEENLHFRAYFGAKMKKKKY